MQIEVKVLGEMAHLKEEVSLPMLRVAQEALTNVFRHAHASTAIIVLKIREGSVELSISDDGVGMRSQWQAPRPRELASGGCATALKVSADV
jgi:signal transduction histidine kinase